ncbi:MAG TPA: hypothetical protein VK011_08165 [Acidimicrobiia bacterium]|nr:hypothetical protein [Acidimicrobiia bacterium]
MKAGLVLATGLGVVASIGLSLAVGFGLIAGHLAVLFILACVLAYSIGRRVALAEERRWLPGLLVAAMVAKLIGATFRYWLLFSIYGGTGDAVAYHRVGVQIAQVWRELSVPAIDTVPITGSFGTKLVAWLTGLLYVPFEQSILGGFWLFSLLAFIGQVFLYLAFRNAAARPAWRRYAVVVFFWPTLLYWPSSIGKEAVIIFFMGVAAWGAAHLYRRFRFAWLVPVAASVAAIGLIRIHVAALLVGSILIGAVFARGPRGIAAAFRRFGMVALGLAAMVPLASGVAQEFGVSLQGSISIESLEPAFGDISTRTEEGGSAVDAGAITSPADIPMGILKVVFRPLPNEISNIQTAAAAFEGTLLIGFVLWRIPAMVRNSGRLRTPYMLMSFVYTCGFIFAWSAISNLGIIARQRSLVMPFILALVVGLGWRDSIDVRPGAVLERRLRDPGIRASAAGQPLPSEDRLVSAN